VKPMKQTIVIFAALATLPALAALPASVKPVAAPQVAPALPRVSPARYSVSTTIFDGKATTTAPRLVARTTEPATLRQGNGKQIFDLIVTPGAQGQFLVRSNLVQWTPNGLVTNAAVADATADGMTRCLTIMKRDAKTGKSVPMHVDVVIKKIV
jgi:hypothetical protein